MINHKNFTYKALIDWIEIEITTTSPTNFWTIREIAGLCYVEPLDESKGGAATIFKFRLYDINTWKQVERTIETLKEYRTLAGEPRIIGIEVSFDAYSISNLKNDLREHTAEYFRMVSNPLMSNKNQRAAGIHKGSAEPVSLKIGNYLQVDNKTFYIGSQKDDDASMRVYFKKTDSSLSLAIEEQCARIEITLKNTECPFSTIKEAEHFKFEHLAKWFRFRRVKEGITNLQTIITGYQSQIGEIKKRKVRATGKTKYRLYHPFTKSNTELNTKAYEQLRLLTKRLAKTRILKKSRDVH